MVKNMDKTETQAAVVPGFYDGIQKHPRFILAAGDYDPKYWKIQNIARARNNAWIRSRWLKGKGSFMNDVTKI